MNSRFIRLRPLLLQDTDIILLSVLIALILAKTGILIQVLTQTKGMEIVGSFVAGMFFTSILTTAPATVVLGEIAQSNSVLLVAIFGGLGALIGDFIIFRFVRDRFSEHLILLLNSKRTRDRIKFLLKLKSLKWLTFALAGIIIASPLPDELGISLLGFSKTRTSLFIPFSFVANSTGVLFIGLIGKSLI